MPALVNIKVGSFLITMGAEGTISCPFERKNSKNLLRMSALVIINAILLGLIFASERPIFVHSRECGVAAKVKIKPPFAASNRFTIGS